MKPATNYMLSFRSERRSKFKESLADEQVVRTQCLLVEVFLDPEIKDVQLLGEWLRVHRIPLERKC